MRGSSENSHFSKIGIFYAKMNCYHGKLWKISGLLLEIDIMQGISWTFMLPRGKIPPEYLQIGIFLNLFNATIASFFRMILSLHVITVPSLI